VHIGASFAPYKEPKIATARATSGKLFPHHIPNRSDTPSAVPLLTPAAASRSI
jgi:hypothetical protein